MSSEIESFIKKFDGKAAPVSVAVKELGAEGLNDTEISLYDFKEPKVIATNGNCYTIEAPVGLTTRTYDGYWENGKIKNITDKGFK